MKTGDGGSQVNVQGNTALVGGAITLKAATLITVSDSDFVFGPNMRYAVFLPSVDGAIYMTENIAGPFKAAEAYEVLQKHVKYQAKIEFSSKPAIALPY